ncbi:MAG TPA: sigma-54 dependent transcriptional regulator [Lacipirellulaceae bacterium]|nr:sigma-54 dependent transcriptional regulator [Lacipirellulaceae bacterium]
MPRARILVVDDHTAARASVMDVLSCAGYHVRGASSAVEALARLEAEAFEVLITDLQMPGLDGIELIRQMATRRLRTQVIMVTAHATIMSAVEAMKLGAFDYIEKPFSASSLESAVALAVARGQMMVPESDLQIDDASFSHHLGMVGDSVPMQMLRRRLRQVAETDETVLICGESGTGKELVARAIHAASRRSGGPLVSLNCPALSPQLAESELFGHQRGAFTGAEADRSGRFEMAEGGTLLLDEITEVDLSLQAKLLRVLQEKTFERVGSSQALKADVRIVATTNRILENEIADGRFRQDLYYRLAVVPLDIPPLRDRVDDVIPLCNHFLDRASRRLNRPRVPLAPDAVDLLVKYHWPGNVRELENLVTRACVLSIGEPIQAKDLSPWLQAPRSTPSHADGHASIPCEGTTLDEMEQATIIATLQKFSGNRARAAAALGIGVRTLSGKLRQYGFAPRTREFSLTGAYRQNVRIESAVSAAHERKHST